MILRSVKPLIQPLKVGNVNRLKMGRGVLWCFPIYAGLPGSDLKPLRGDFQPTHASPENGQVLTSKGPNRAANTFNSMERVYSRAIAFSNRRCSVPLESSDQMGGGVRSPDPRHWIWGPCTRKKVCSTWV